MEKKKKKLRTARVMQLKIQNATFRPDRNMKLSTAVLH